MAISKESLPKILLYFHFIFLGHLNFTVIPCPRVTEFPETRNAFEVSSYQGINAGSTSSCCKFSKEKKSRFYAIKFCHSLTFNFWCETVYNLIQLQQSIRLEFFYSFIIKRNSMFEEMGEKLRRQGRVRFRSRGCVHQMWFCSSVPETYFHSHLCSMTRVCETV